MADKKPGPVSSARPQTPTTETSATSARKPWIKKSPVDVVIDQIDKQRQRVNEKEEELKKDRRELQKLEEARKVLEAK